jgi:hypothetical protein
MTPVLLDLLRYIIPMAIGFAAAWLISGIYYDARLRRIRIDTWREAAAKYHGLIDRAYRNQSKPHHINLP